MLELLGRGIDECALAGPCPPGIVTLFRIMNGLFRIIYNYDSFC